MAKETFWGTCKEMIFEEAYQAIAMALMLLSIWGAHWLVKHTVGLDAMLFDALRVGYLVDGAHAAAWLRFIWGILWKIAHRNDAKNVLNSPVNAKQGAIGSVPPAAVAATPRAKKKGRRR